MVYSTVPLTPAIRTSVQNDYYIGSYARFQDPATAISISNRTDFHNLSHLQIRETLDRENKTGLFFLIDSRTLESNAIWYVESREASLAITESIGPGPNQPRSYANESYVLWQSRMLTQDVDIAWRNLDIYNIDFTDVLVDPFPYDPHDPQPVPYTLGLDFSTEQGARGFYGEAFITALGSELLWSNSTNATSGFLPRPRGVIRLTPAAATGAGLLSRWTLGPPQPYGVDETSDRFMQQYDWNSPIWPPNPPTNATIPPGPNNEAFVLRNRILRTPLLRPSNGGNTVGQKTPYIYSVSDNGQHSVVVARKSPMRSRRSRLKDLRISDAMSRGG